MKPVKYHIADSDIKPFLILRVYLMVSGALPGAFVTWCDKRDDDVTALPQSLLPPVTRSWHLCRCDKHGVYSE